MYLAPICSGAFIFYLGERIKMNPDALQTINQISKEVAFFITLTGEIVYISENCSAITGYQMHELIGTSIYDILRKCPVFQESLYPQSFEAKLYHKNTNFLLMDVQYIASYADGSTPIGFLGTMICITKYKNLDDCKNDLLDILDTSKDIIYYYQVFPQTKWIYLSPSIERILGHSLETNYHDPSFIFSITHPDDSVKLYEKATGRMDYSKPIELRWKHRNGQYIWFEDIATPIYDGAEKLIAVQGICRDITSRKTREKELEDISSYDCLTKTYNRFSFEREVEKLDTSLNARAGILLYDLNNLKYINDTFGHALGDYVLKEVAQLFNTLVNDRTSVYRIGGDEFVILAQNICAEDVNILFARVAQMIQAYNQDHPDLPIDISGGYAYTKSSNGNMLSLFQSADQNMYSQKYEKSPKPLVISIGSGG